MSPFSERIGGLVEIQPLFVDVVVADPGRGEHLTALTSVPEPG